MPGDGAQHQCQYFRIWTPSETLLIVVNLVIVANLGIVANLFIVANLVIVANPGDQREEAL